MIDNKLSAIDCALDYIEKGWFVLPVRPNSKEPNGRLVKRGFLGATRYPKQVREWFKIEPNSNIGIACEMSGLLVLDFDYKNLKLPNPILDKFKAIETLRVETGNGFHLYFIAPKNLTIVPGKLIDGIDVKYRGFVVAPPSRHKNGKHYVADKTSVALLTPSILYETVKQNERRVHVYK